MALALATLPDDEEPEPRVRPPWAAYERALRRELRPGPHAWLNSRLP